jgi:hypothetical protein
MPIHDEEDDDESWRDDSTDMEAEEPDARDTHHPDDFVTVRCTQCGKHIFEDTEYCPYCKHYQLDEERTAQPAWFKILAVFLALCMAGIVGYLMIYGIR